MSYSTDDPSAIYDLDNMTNFASDQVNDTSNMTFTDVVTEEVAFALNVYFTPLLVILGTIGNLLSIIVFFKSKLRAQSTSQYLSALAISDTVCLLQLVPPWLKAVRVSLVFGRNGFCQCFVYLTYVSSSSSSWLVVAFTVERFVAVLYPLQRTHMCTVRRARLLIAAILICCVIINTPVLLFAVPKSYDCNIDYDLMDHAARFNVIDTIFTFTLPLTIITVLNIWIMIGVCRLNRTRGLLIKEEERYAAIRTRRAGMAAGRAALAAGRGGARGVRRARPSLQRSQQRITRMLLIVSSAFVLLNLPAYTMRIIAYANNMSSREYSGRWAALQQICLLLFNSNFGTNFFLYCMTGQNFRRALCQVFWCWGRWRAAARRGCGAAIDTPPPLRPSITNSLTFNTEASGYTGAPDRASQARPCKGRRGSIYTSYTDIWRIRNTLLDENDPQLYELQECPVHSNWLPGRRRSSVPRWPDDSDVTHSFRDQEQQTSPGVFRPIQYELVPGQIAPPHPACPERTSTPLRLNSSLFRMSPLEGEPFPMSIPRSPDELEGFGMRTSPVLRRPQPRRRFTLPAREPYGLERGRSPVASDPGPRAHCS